MAVAIQRFDWESVGSQSVWQHTEYVIELRADLSAAGFQDLPELPPKESLLQRVFGGQEVRATWQERRREGLQCYMAELLLRPELRAHPCARQLLALDGDSSTPMRPEPPCVFRVRPVSGSCTAGKQVGSLEIVVQQEVDADAPPEGTAVVAQVVVVCAALPAHNDAGCDGAAGGPAACSPGGREVAARVRFHIARPTEELRELVDLEPGTTYAIEACSLSVLGMLSERVELIARLPCLADSKHAFAPEGRVAGDGSAASPSPTALDADQTASGVSAVGRVASDPPGAMWVRPAKFRGSAAAEYVAAATEKAKAAYEKSPYQLIKVVKDDGPKAAQKVVVKVEVESALAAHETLGRRRSVHQEVDSLDHERTLSQRQQLEEDVCVASAWLADVTGKEELRKAGGSLSALREALLSGEILCELANILAIDIDTSGLDNGESHEVALAAGAALSGSTFCSSSSSASLALAVANAASLEAADAPAVALSAASPDAASPDAADAPVDATSPDAALDAADASADGPPAASPDRTASDAADALADALTAASPEAASLDAADAPADASAAAAADAALSVARGAAQRLPVPAYNKAASTSFARMENVSRFIGACRDFYEVPEHQLFCTGDLSEARDLPAVVRCLLALRQRVSAKAQRRGARPSPPAG
eukprot:TRINITY_DN18387_c0_g3_i1.p1 TRINITY_DN18387_c0_g3~~TRINITY_DN18387_c0_g3_i1.p1  ORF type:complete len:659 (+),score=179.33 TRINITY_DN18387_c0_g3_i1:97-2073(+)